MAKENWTEVGLLGAKIVRVRYMTVEEANQMGWDKQAMVLELDNGTALWASRDDEGNDAGAMFGRTKEDGDITLPVRRKR